MKNELISAVDFLSELLSKKVPQNHADQFRASLLRALSTHYQDHWFPEKPFRGSAYRCIRINHKMDPIIAQAGAACGFTEEKLFSLFPNEFTMWVDPREVSYRIGEEGSIALLYEGKEGSNVESTNCKDHFLGEEDLIQSPSRSPSPPSPSRSPVMKANSSPSPPPVCLSPQTINRTNNYHNNNMTGNYHHYSHHQNYQQQQQQRLSPVHYHQPHHFQQNDQQAYDQSSSAFFRTCKDQLRYIFPESNESMNFEYFSTFVAS